MKARLQNDSTLKLLLLPLPLPLKKNMRKTSVDEGRIRILMFSNSLVCLLEGHKGNQRAGEPLLQRHAEEVGLVQLGSVSGETSLQPSSTSSEPLNRKGSDFLHDLTEIGHGGMVLS